MIVLNELHKNHIIDSLTAPLVLPHCWMFSGAQLDFVLKEIEYIEETLGPTITLSIGESEVRIPGAWNVMIVDMETYVIDTVPVTACAAFEHMAFVFSPLSSKLIVEPIKVVKFEPKGICISPSIDKNTGLVHSISTGVSHGKQIPRGVIVGPNDLHRAINGKVVGDILG